MDHVTLDPSQYYMVLPLNELTPEGGETEKGVEEIFGSTYINPMDMRQYLYKLIPKESHKLELRAMVCIDLSFLYATDEEVKLMIHGEELRFIFYENETF